MAFPTHHSLSCEALYHHTREKVERLREELQIEERVMENVLLMEHGRTHPEHPDKIFYIAESSNPFDDDSTLKYSRWKDVAERYSSDIPVTEWDTLTSIPLYEPAKHCKICGVSDHDHKSWIGYNDSVLCKPEEHSDHKAEF